MQVKSISQDDYKEICEWWKEHKWPVIDTASLSKNGFIVNDNENLLAGWVYSTDSNIVWVEFIVANPKIKGERRDQAFDLFFKEVRKFCKENNYSFMFTSVQHPKLMTRLEKTGFNKTDDNMTNFIGRV